MTPSSGPFVDATGREGDERRRRRNRKGGGGGGRKGGTEREGQREDR